MDVAVSRSPSPRPLACSLPPQPASSPANLDRAALERLVLHQLFNAPGPSARSASTPVETVAALYARLVTQRDFSTVDADQQTLIDALRESSRHGALRAASSLDNCTLGKLLHVLCQLWRERSTRTFDAGLLVEAATLCGDLIERRKHFKLETCGVIMFHLGELITYPPLRPMCERLICDHLEPRFRSELRGQLHLPLSGPQVMFGLISTLRAAELRVAGGNEGAPPRTAADALLTTVHMLLLRQPDFLGRCSSAMLGLAARHAMHYLSRLSALPPAYRATPIAEERERTVAHLVRRCIDEVSVPSPRDADGGGTWRPPGVGGHLRHATPCYLDWLAGQPGPVRARLALRDAAAALGVPGGEHLPASVSTAGAAPADGSEAAFAEPGSRLSRFTQAVAALPKQGHGSQSMRDRAYAAANALIASIQLGWTQPSLSTRARVLLDMDTLYQHLDEALPMDAQSCAIPLATVRAFLESQLVQMVDGDGAQLLGPSPPLIGGLYSWQRMLLSTLVEEAATNAAV